MILKCTHSNSRVVQISVVKYNKGFSNCIVNVHMHRNLLLDNKRAITSSRWCAYPKPTAKYILFGMKLPTSC